MVKFQYCFVKHWLTHVSMDFYLRKVNYNEDIMTVSRYNFYSKSQSHSQGNMKMCNATQPHPLLFFDFRQYFVNSYWCFHWDFSCRCCCWSRDLVGA